MTQWFQILLCFAQARIPIVHTFVSRELVNKLEGSMGYVGNPLE